MNYKKHYDLLVQKAQQRPKLFGYVERHHIVPKSLGGSDDVTNLVEFTAREHCLAHLLLARIYNHHKMWFAANMMSRIHKTTSRAYEAARKKHSDIMREKMTGSNNPMFGRNGDKNPMFGKKRPDFAEYSRSRTGEKAPLFGVKGKDHPKFGVKNHHLTERNKRNSGSKNHNFKGNTIATCLSTGAELVLVGGKEIAAAGFDNGKVSMCISGKRKSHKGHTFRRVTA